MRMLTHRGAVGASAGPHGYYGQTKQWLRRRIAGRLRCTDRVVELGCGPCELARFLAERNQQEVMGVDISAGGFPTHRGLDTRLKCRKADARRLDFLPDRSVDAAVSVHALHEMQEPLKALQEANRVLRDGGVAVVVDFPRDSLAQRLWNERYFTADRMAEMLRQAGFTEVKSDHIARGQLIWAEARKGP